MRQGKATAGRKLTSQRLDRNHRIGGKSGPVARPAAALRGQAVGQHRSDGAICWRSGEPCRAEPRSYHCQGPGSPREQPLPERHRDTVTYIPCSEPQVPLAPARSAGSRKGSAWEWSVLLEEENHVTPARVGPKYVTVFMKQSTKSLKTL